MEVRQNALKVFDYVFNTKRTLNISALFSDGTKYYRNPPEVQLAGFSLRWLIPMSM